VKNASTLDRLLARTLVLAQVLSAVPVAAQSPAPPQPEPPPALREPNRALPKVEPPSSELRLPALPSEADLRRARVFDEGLVPTGRTHALENRALARALESYAAGDLEDVSALTAFLASHPRTAWRPSLLTALGQVYRQRGYFSRALIAFEQAWAATKDSRHPAGRPIGERAVSELVDLSARLGRFDRLEKLFAEADARDVGGAARERIVAAKEGLWMMNFEPEKSFLCGPYAVSSVLRSLAEAAGVPAEEQFTAEQRQAVDDLPSTRRGTSLAQVEALAQKVGLDYRAARRNGSAEIPLPAVVHWKSGHFAALVAQEEGRYKAQDPTFGGAFWVTPRALDDESSGYFLVPASAPADAWTEVPAGEAAGIWGKGITNADNLPDQCPECPMDQQSGGGDSCSDGSCAGMAGYSVYTMLVSLHLKDEPVGYSPPVGPGVHFNVHYSQREAFQPQTFTFWNLGPKWNSTWISYLADDPANPSATVKLYAGGGERSFTGLSSTTTRSARERRSEAYVERVSADPIRYELHAPSGAVDVFEAATGVSPRRVFLTERRDPQGNAIQLTYDQDMRLVAITDAVGQVTTLSYELASDPLKLTRVTDPFGRFATFEYDSQGRLERVTDVLGLASAFTYGTGDFVSAMTTPYGTTRFKTREVNPGTGSRIRWVQITDPLGGTEHIEFRQSAPGIAPEDSTPPTGISIFRGANNSQFLHGRNTFVWSKQAWAEAPGDYTKATIYHFLHHDSGTTSGIVESLKRPLESRVYYTYPGQSNAGLIGTRAQPNKQARVLDDGTTQLYQYEYNAAGRRIKAIDPLGRETVYVYGTGSTPDAAPATGEGIDLLEVKQKRGATHDVLARYTYNAQHLPLTATDAAGQTTTYTYNAAGQVLTVTTPERAGITETRVTTYTYDPNGRLQTVTGPASGATTTYAYDALGRVQSVTDPDGHTVSYQYDAFDRVTRVNYPDGTYEETVYERLDAVRHRDRLGRWSETRYDALRRVVYQRDPAGRVVQQEWCDCGSLDALVDPNGNRTRWERDVQGRVVKEIRPDGAEWNYTYEARTSRLKQVTDAKGQVKTYSYAKDDRLLSIGYTNEEHETPDVAFAYDTAFPRLTSMQDGTGTTAYSYHPIPGTPALGAGMLATVDGPLADDTISYQYDELGRVKRREVNGIANRVDYGYDALGRMSSQANLLGTFTFAYDGVTSRLSTVTYPNGQTSTYTYEPTVGDHRLKQILHKKPDTSTLAQFDYTTDAGGRILTWRQQQEANPAKEYTFGYDLADQLTSGILRDVASGEVVKSYAYGYDPAGNRTFEAIDQQVTAASFNGRNQLLAQSPGGLLSFQGATDEPATVTVAGTPAQPTAAGGFQATVPVTPGQSQQVVVTATDGSGNVRTATYQVDPSGTAATFTYDPNGNMTSDGSKTYTWDAENRLVEVKQGGNMLAAFAYDGEGRRYSTTTGGVTKTFVNDGMDVAEARVGAATTRHFQGSGLDFQLGDASSVGPSTFIVSDHVGSTWTTTLNDGSVSLARDYDPWGRLLSGSSSAGYAYTGREWEADAQIYYYRARYYAADLGRFVSEDPSGIEGSLNLYEYAGNAPAFRVDPLGLFKVDASCTASGKWKQSDTQQVEEWCRNLDRIPDPKLRECVRKSCEKGTIKCRANSTDKNCDTPYSEYGGKKTEGYACRRHLGFACRTANVCVDNLCDGQPRPKGRSGWVVIHEWQHGCGWGARGKDDKTWHPPGGAEPPGW
jgi:RHS repeat-associated protein